jgi:uncharacterized integral membrane protein (TIGR00697 family)
MDRKRHSSVFLILSVLFISALLVAEILATKQVEFFRAVNTNAGYIVFPITYILSDVVSEVYGYRASRRLSWLAFAVNLFMVCSFQIAILLPCPEWWTGQSSFASVLGSTPRILLASLAAFQFGNWFNDILFLKLKSRHGERSFWIRALASSVIGEAVDSALFFTIAFFGSVPLYTIPNMVIMGVVTKVLYEVILMPVTLRIIRAVRSYEGEGVYQPAKGLGIFG